MQGRVFSLLLFQGSLENANSYPAYQLGDFSPANLLEIIY